MMLACTSVVLSLLLLPGCVAGRVLRALGKPMLEALADAPVVRQHAPELFALVQKELEVTEPCQSASVHSM